MRLRVMTFNVRYLNNHDGRNVWPNRRDLAADIIRQAQPEVFGTQELHYEQGRDLSERLPDYSWFGVDRCANGKDEHMGVFYRREALELLESGNFWLSETPMVVGSRSWDIDIPRMVTWGLFEDRASREQFYFYNTHLPHRRTDIAARLECATILVHEALSLPEELPVILTGDFNENAGSGTYELLLSYFADAWVTADRRQGPAITFNGFSGRADTFRIDWILYRGPVRALEARTITAHQDGIYPSDHYPVSALLELKA